MKKILIVACFLILPACSWEFGRVRPEPPMGVAKIQGLWHLQAFNRDGVLLWEEGPDKKNMLVDQGESSILDTYFRATNAPTQFYMHLYNDTCAETKTPTTLTGEPSGSGYAPQLVERSTAGFPTLASVGGDYKVTSTTETFNATGTWTVNALGLTTASDTTGILVECLALSGSRTLNDGDSLNVTFAEISQ